ncbi:MAG TPA: hypothetical protein VLB69_04475, partial [Rudaea sp.]|nr:hypothetical protein [Rudaea sp.]
MGQESGEPNAALTTPQDRSPATRSRLPATVFSPEARPSHAIGAAASSILPAVNAAEHPDPDTSPPGIALCVDLDGTLIR